MELWVGERRHHFPNVFFVFLSVVFCFWFSQFGEKMGISHFGLKFQTSNVERRTSNLDPRTLTSMFGLHITKFQLPTRTSNLLLRTHHPLCLFCFVIICFCCHTHTRTHTHPRSLHCVRVCFGVCVCVRVSGVCVVVSGVCVCVKFHCVHQKCFFRKMELKSLNVRRYKFFFLNWALRGPRQHPNEKR